MWTPVVLNVYDSGSTVQCLVAPAMPRLQSPRDSNEDLFCMIAGALLSTPGGVLTVESHDPVLDHFYISVFDISNIFHISYIFYVPSRFCSWPSP